MQMGVAYTVTVDVLGIGVAMYILQSRTLPLYADNRKEYMPQFSTCISSLPTTSGLAFETEPLT